MRPALEQVKPVLMIADSEGNAGHFESCFQANYGDELNQALFDIAKSEKNVSTLDLIRAKHRSSSPAGYYQLNSSFDTPENSAILSPEIREAMDIISFTMEGMPSLYCGEEWAIFDQEAFYTKLVQLKNYNKSLWNGIDGGMVERINDSEDIYAFSREKDGHRIVVIVNCSTEAATTTLTEDIFAMSALFGKKDLNISEGTPIRLDPWEYWLFANPSVETL